MSQTSEPTSSYKTMIISPKNHRKVKMYSIALSRTQTSLLNDLLSKAIEELEKEKFSEDFVRDVNNSINAESPLIS